MLNDQKPIVDAMQLDPGIVVLLLLLIFFFLCSIQCFIQWEIVVQR